MHAAAGEQRDRGIGQRAASLAARWAAEVVPSAVASRIYVHQLRSFSSVLDDERP